VGSQGEASANRPDRALPWLFALVVVAGAVLRFSGLDAQSLWNDELSSWEQSHQESLADVIEIGVRPTTYPPAFQIGLYYVIRGIGDSETALRFPSAIAGVLAILAIYGLGAQIYGRREALIAATLLAFSYQPIYYSQEARAYSFVLLFSILSAYFWFRITRCLRADATPSVGAQAGYLACAITTTYLHYFGLLLVAVQFAGWLALFIARPRALGRIALLGGLVALAYVPWFPYFVEEFAREEIYIEEPGFHSIASYWRFLFYNPGEQLKWFAVAVFAVAAGRSLGTRPGGAHRISLRAALSSDTALVIAWLVVPFAIAFARSKISLPMITDRNLIISIAPAYLLFARAITRCVGDTRLQALTVGAMVAVMLHGLFVTGRYYTEPRKEQFREAAAVVAEREDEFPNAVVIGHAWSKGKFDYYLERLGAESRVDLKAGAAGDIDRMRRHIATHRPDYVWFLLGHMQPERPFIETLDRDFELIFHVPLYRAFVRLYRVPKEPLGGVGNDEAPPARTGGAREST
jgi:4-amino-4-deoxy-L-arabinose transferase-like glycosyltransferase